MGQVEIGHSSKTSLIQETLGGNLPREWDFRPLCGTVNYCVFRPWTHWGLTVPQTAAELSDRDLTNEDRRSEDSFRNTSLYKMQGFIVTCSFWGEFELNLYNICLRSMTNIINYIRGLVETKKMSTRPHFH